MAGDEPENVTPGECLALPSRAEAERLVLVMEEMAEASQAACKALRHGLESYNPADVFRTTNRDPLLKELGDVLFALRLLCEADDVAWRDVLRAALSKAVVGAQYLHFQGELPALVAHRLREELDRAV